MATGSLLIAVKHGDGVGALVTTAIVIPIVFGLLMLTPRLDAWQHRRDFRDDPDLVFSMVATFDPNGARRAMRVRVTSQGIEWGKGHHGVEGQVAWDALRDVRLADGPWGLLKSTYLTLTVDGGQLEFLVTTPRAKLEAALAAGRERSRGSR